jgi:HlyD family secretion protein
MGPKQTFRKAALERLSSPERLDEMMRVTSPKAWVALWAAAFLILIAIVWSIFGKIPERVDGVGILLPGGTTRVLAAPLNGVVLEVLVKPGEEFQPGTNVMRMGVGADATELELLQKRRTQLVTADEQATVAEAQQLAAEEASVVASRQQVESERQANYVSLQTAQTKYQRGMALRGTGISESELDTRRAELQQAVAAYESAGQKVKELDARSEQVRGTNRDKREARAKEIAQLDIDIEKQSRKVQSAEYVQATESGRVFEIPVRAGVNVDRNETLLRYELLNQDLKAILYVPSGPGAKILDPKEHQSASRQQPINLSPSTVKKEEWGTIKAIVAEKAAQPATRSGMIADLGNEQLVDEYIKKQGVPFRVLADLEKSPTAPETSTGYAWTSGDGPPHTRIGAGTPVTAVIITNYKRPIDYVVPIFDIIDNWRNARAVDASEPAQAKPE